MIASCAPLQTIVSSANQVISWNLWMEKTLEDVYLATLIQAARLVFTRASNVLPADQAEYSRVPNASRREISGLSVFSG